MKNAARKVRLVQRAGGRAGRSARGVTLLEAVLSVVLLGFAVASITSAISHTLALESRGRKILAANEIANRLVLQFLSEPKKMPLASDAIEYGPYSFTYEKDQSRVTLEPSATTQRNTPGGANKFALSRFQLVTITVYDAEFTRSGQALKGEELATIARVYDPITPRNADVMEKLDPQSIQEMIRVLIEGAQ